MRIYPSSQLSQVIKNSVIIDEQMKLFKFEVTCFWVATTTDETNKFTTKFSVNFLKK